MSHKQDNPRNRILVVFPHGNAFDPKAGNESRVRNIINQIVTESEVLTLESKEYKSVGVQLKSVTRFFFRPLIVKNIHFGSFFADLNPSYIIQLFKIIRNYNPQIVQVSYPHGLVIAKILTKLFSPNFVPVIYDAHDVEAKRHREVTLQETNCSRVKKWVIYLYDCFIERLCCSLADHILAVSDDDKNEFCTRYSADENKITVIPTGTILPKLENYDKT